jgi:hypothetical protein
MLAFTILWIYTFFAQYLIIWYANLPDETGRLFRPAEWPVLGLFLAVLHPEIRAAVPDPDRPAGAAFAWCHSVRRHLDHRRLLGGALHVDRGCSTGLAAGVLAVRHRGNRGRIRCRLSAGAGSNEKIRANEIHSHYRRCVAKLDRLRLPVSSM